MEEKLDMYDSLMIAILIIDVLMFLLLIRTYREIDDFNKRQNEVIEVDK